MSLDARKPAPVWDALDLDLVVRVAHMTILNPLFAMWVPILTLSQRYSTSSTGYQLSIAYFLVTLFYALISFSSTAWSNKVWRSKSLVTALFSGPALDWDAQIVVVTGGTGGIGRLLVETLGVMGVTVVVIDRKEYVSDWDDVYSYVCDLTDEKAVAKVVKQIQEEVGHPTILVNNAGVVSGKLLVDLRAEDVRRTFDVNVLAQFSLLKAFLPHMLEQQGGHIVTVSSVFGLAGGVQLSDYSASKHALIGLHESLKHELRYRYSDVPIRTTLVVPGHVRTPLFGSINPSSRLVSFLAPTIGPHTIAKAIIAALDTDQSREIYLPLYGGWLWIVKGFPSWGRDFLVRFSGANEAMEGFVPATEQEKKDQ